MNWLKKQNVMIPLDFSEAADAALMVAREFVEDVTQLHLFYVLPILHPTDPAVIWHTATDESREQRVEEALQQKLKELGYEGADIHVVIGNPETEIIQYAKSKSVDLIVMPTHDERGVSPFLFGSVTEYVVRHAPCPVLVVR